MKKTLFMISSIIIGTLIITVGLSSAIAFTIQENNQELEIGSTQSNPGCESCQEAMDSITDAAQAHIDDLENQGVLPLPYNGHPLDWILANIAEYISEYTGAFITALQDPENQYDFGEINFDALQAGMSDAYNDKLDEFYIKLLGIPAALIAAGVFAVEFICGDGQEPASVPGATPLASTTSSCPCSCQIEEESVSATSQPTVRETAKSGLR